MTDLISISTPVQGSPSRISWGSVIAGVVIAISLMCCLSEMVMALGLTFLKPQDPGRDSTIPTIAVSGALAWVLTALISLLAGGWAAAHLARQAHETDSVLHGLLVWGLGVLAMAVVATSTAGLLIGGAFSLVSSGLSAAGSAAGGLVHGTGAVLGGVAKSSGAQAGLPSFNWDSIKFQAQNLLKEAAPPGRSTEGGQQGQQGQQGSQGGAGNPATPGSDGMALLSRLFSSPGATLSSSDRDAATSMLMSTASMSREAAAKQVQDWETAYAEAGRRYEALKSEAEQKARAAAAAAASALAEAAWVAFVATILGASAAMLGGYLGGYRRSHLSGRQAVGQPAIA